MDNIPLKLKGQVVLLVFQMHSWCKFVCFFVCYNVWKPLPLYLRSKVKPKS